MEHINNKPTNSATFRPHQTELLFRGVASSSDHLHKHVWPKQGLNYTKEVILRAFYNQNKMSSLLLFHSIHSLLLLLGWTLLGLGC